MSPSEGRSGLLILYYDQFAPSPPPGKLSTGSSREIICDASQVQVQWGKAQEKLPRLEGNIDFLFIDGRPKEYLEYLKACKLKAHRSFSSCSSHPAADCCPLGHLGAAAYTILLPFVRRLRRGS